MLLPRETLPANDEPRDWNDGREPNDCGANCRGAAAGGEKDLDAIVERATPLPE